MNTHRGLLAAATILSVLLGAGAAARADRQAADFFAQRGEKALKDRKWAEAQAQFRKAVEEEATHLSARVGLGEAFFGAGDRGAAVDAWRRAVTDAAEMKPFPAVWGEALGRARKRLLEVDSTGTALSKLVDGHVEKLVAFAERCGPKDGELAARALRDAVRLRPDHPKATALFTRLGAPPTEWKPLFDGRTKLGWDVEEDDRMWKVIDGEFVGDITTGTYVMSHKTTFKGDFDFRVEAKILERREGVAAFVIGGAVKFNSQGTFLALANTDVMVREQDGTTQDAQHVVFAKALADLPSPFDPTEWTTYELQFRGAQLHILVNGVELLTRERASGREEGALAFIIQSIRVAVRKVEALQR